jgi:ribosomal-protein-alanine N-acetyltransferase
MLCEACSFETSRLVVDEWHRWAKHGRSDSSLLHVIPSIMTEPVTRSLPSHWQGAYDVDRARGWIAERDREGPTLMVADRSTGEALGLLILHELEADDEEGVDIRLGYMLAERAWGRGLASELVAGFVDWCRSQGGIRSIAGGVAHDNPASIRVLEKNGFRPLRETQQHSDGELIFELSLKD